MSNDQQAIQHTCMTPGWTILVRRVQDRVSEYKKAAFDCATEKEVLEKWRMAQAAQEVFDDFLHDLAEERLGTEKEQ